MVAERRAPYLDYVAREHGKAHDALKFRNADKRAAAIRAENQRVSNVAAGLTARSEDQDRGVAAQRRASQTAAAAAEEAARQSARAETRFSSGGGSLFKKSSAANQTGANKPPPRRDNNNHGSVPALDGGRGRKHGGGGGGPTMHGGNPDEQRRDNTKSWSTRAWDVDGHNTDRFGFTKHLGDRPGGGEGADREAFDWRLETARRLDYHHHIDSGHKHTRSLWATSPAGRAATAKVNAVQQAAAKQAMQNNSTRYGGDSGGAGGYFGGAPQDHEYEYDSDDDDERDPYGPEGPLDPAFTDYCMAMREEAAGRNFAADAARARVTARCDKRAEVEFAARTYGANSTAARDASRSARAAGALHVESGVAAGVSSEHFEDRFVRRDDGGAAPTPDDFINENKHATARQQPFGGSRGGGGGGYGAARFGSSGGGGVQFCSEDDKRRPGAIKYQGGRVADGNGFSARDTGGFLVL